MFKELAPYLRQRAVLLTVTHLEEDQIRVTLIPQKLKDGENAALMTPVSLTGTAEDLDRDLPGTLVDFVAAHLQLKNTLDRAKAEMDAAAKAAQSEARAKAKAPGKKDVANPVSVSTPTPEPTKSEPPKTASLFDVPAVEPPVAPPAIAPIDEEEEILAEAAEEDEVEHDELEAA